MVKAGVQLESFAQDIEGLVGTEKSAPIVALLMPLLQEAYPQLIQQAAMRTIAEHGKVVRDVHWRMDIIKGSNHVMNLDMPVATITLQFQDGPTTGQASYQMMPDQAAKLKEALTAIIG